MRSTAMARNRTRIAAFITVLFILICYQWFLTAGKITNKWPRGTFYYDLQSRAFISGHLHLLETPPPELLALPDSYDPVSNRDLLKMNDLTLYNGKYYTNWGPVPALIVSIVHLVFTSKLIYDSFVFGGFLYGLLMFNTLLILWLRQHIFDQLPIWIIVLTILLISMSHPIPWLLSRPVIYETAITGGQFFLVSGLYWSVSALENSRPNFLRLFLAGTSLGLAVGTRITLLLTVLFFTGTFIYMIFRQAQKNGWLNIYLLTISCIIGPLLLNLLLLGFYNYSRFGSFLETGVQYTLTTGLNQHLLAQEGKLVSREYVLPNFINYITNGVGLQPVFPYLKALPGKWLPKQTPIFRLEEISGVIWALPFVFLSLLPIIKFLGSIFQKVTSLNRDLLGLIRSDEGLLKTYIPFLFGGGALFAFLPLLTFFATTMRYEEDFVPLLMFLSVWGFWSILEKYSEKAILRRSIMLIGTTLSLISLSVAFLLGVTGYSGHFQTHNPELIYRIRNYLAVKVPFFLAYDYGSSTYYEQADRIWQNRSISLWKWKDESRAYLIDLKNPYGWNMLENSQRFFWLGGGPSNFELIASHDGFIKLSLKTIPGPSLPNMLECHLNIVLPDGRKEFRTVLPGAITFKIPVVRGRNMFAMEVTDMPSLEILPNGDPRHLMLGVQAINIQWLKK